MTNKPDDIFAAYARTAPLEDLRFYLRAAERRLAELNFSEQTVRIIAEMTALEQELLDVPGTPALKHRVWALIDRYKTSIPGWAGNTGALDSWIDPIDSANVYRQAHVDIMTIETDETDETDESVGRHHQGPLTLEQLEHWYEPFQTKADACQRVRVPQRFEPLDGEQVKTLIQSTMADMPLDELAKPIVKARRASTIALACPTCQGALRPVALCANTWGCATCKETWHLAPVAKPRTRPAGIVPRVKQQTPVLDGEKTCRTCDTTQPLEQFAWGAGHTIRNTCLTCRKAQQRAAASRRQQAA